MLAEVWPSRAARFVDEILASSATARVRLVSPSIHPRFPPLSRHPHIRMRVQKASTLRTAATTGALKCTRVDRVLALHTLAHVARVLAYLSARTICNARRKRAKSASAVELCGISVVATRGMRTLRGSIGKVQIVVTRRGVVVSFATG